METKGLIMVHTGDGKGKTTAALGLALRAWGSGLRVMILQFINETVTKGEATSNIVSQQTAAIAGVAQELTDLSATAGKLVDMIKHNKQ